MKSVFIAKFGGPENLEIRDVPDARKPDPTEVLIRVRSAGLNRADLLQRRGHYPPPDGYSHNIPGLEFAGEVVEKGDDVADIAIGDRVFGITAGEAQAEYLTIDHRLVARVPANIEIVEAGGIPEAFITANDAVFAQAKLKGEETLLIHAAGSGVGLAALQLAKAYGHRVIGTSRTKEKLDRCAEFNLDHGIVVSTPAFADEVRVANDGRGVDVILDLVGGSYFDHNLRSLAPKGRLMLVGLTSGAHADFNLGLALAKRLTIIGTVLRGRSLDEKADATSAFVTGVIPMLASRAVRAVIDRVFHFTEVRAAHEYLESNDSFGKVVLEFD